MSESDGTFILVATYPDDRAAREDYQIVKEAHARGLVSLALTDALMRELGLSLITDDQVNTTRFQTAFATPIDAREGVSSGMSAFDRARTIATAIADGTRPMDLIRPGRRSSAPSPVRIESR